MEYDAITLDTNVFDRNGRYLEGGLLAQLVQFKDGSAQFVLSEIVLRELQRHILESTKNAKDDLGKVVRKVSEFELLDSLSRDKLSDILASGLAPDIATKARLKKFISDTGADIIPADTTDIKSLIRSYFETRPPFEGSGKKKNEFPDAIALLSLEQWAKSNAKKILAISHDEGWRDFAAQTDVIDVSDDLTAALSKFQEHAEAAYDFVAKLILELDKGERSDILSEMEDGISYEISNVFPHPDASSAFYHEAELEQMEFQNFSFKMSGGSYSISIVRIGKESIVAQIGVTVTVQATANSSFDVKDGIDKDYVSIGGCYKEIETDIDVGALVTFEGDFSDTSSGDFFVGKVELIDMVSSLDFGDVEPDYGEDY